MNITGGIIKKIRISKNMTQAELAHDIVSPQFLSHFENCKSDIKVQTFLRLLDRLNVKYNEFVSETFDTYTSEINSFIDNLRLAKQSNNIVMLETLILRQQQLYEETNNSRYLHYGIVAKQILNSINDTEFNSSEIDIVMRYLHNVNDWGHYEIILFGNIIFCLNPTQVLSFQHTVLKKIEKYATINKKKGPYAMVILNMANYCLENNCLNQAIEMINKAELLLDGSKSFFELNQKNYLKGIYLIKSGSIEQGTELCNKAIDILIHFKDFANANSKKKELESILIE